MLIGLEQTRRELRPGSYEWSGGASTFLRVGPGEGAFHFERVTVGVVLAPLRSHHAAYGNDRRRALPLLPGQGWVFPAGFEGWCRWDEPNDFLNVEIDDDLLMGAGMPAPSFVPRSGTIDALVTQLAISLHAAGNAAPRLYRDALAVALAAQLTRLAGQPAGDPPAAEPRILRALDYIEAHLADDITLDDLAAVAVMSRFHFARAFRAAVGVPPHAFVVSRRIERAKDLLRSTRLPIAEVAWRVGYSNPAKFAAQFRKLVGERPGAWRGH
ncbi:AraC family transcriptional regulator [Mesorhizobium sp. M0051]|uniref:AraC family transcriptional regulator n=1 Tax=unclassified Mesorhizobium TaxID=325217 RepID=UPI0003CE7507|nr:AraC family transcriptional regulator [Mesorhizobium sp. LNHC252B00]ESY73784.1 AraC family transcriptional regulator [Mesorhizobium sp. LNHC252B00]